MADRGGGVADQRRAAGRVPDQGDPRGQAARPRGSRPTRTTRRRCSGWPAGHLTTPNCAGIASFVAGIAADAAVNSLGAKLVQLTMPGVPDVYQGCEEAALSLVDPDNRRQVDFARIRRDLIELDTGLDASLHGDLAGGRPGRLRQGQAVRHVPGAAAAARPSAVVRRDYEPLARPVPRPGTWSPSGGADRRSRSSPGCPRAAPARRLAGHDAAAARRILGGPADRHRVPGRRRRDDRSDGPAAGGAACSGGSVTYSSSACGRRTPAGSMSRWRARRSRCRR